MGAGVSARTFVDALGAMRIWINSRTTTLVGQGLPLEMGAHLKYVQGGQPKTYAFLEEQLSFASDDAPENRDMIAALSAQVYGGTREAATAAAVALAEEISSNLEGVGATVTLPSGQSVVIRFADDIQGPSWLPDGDLPRLLLNWSVRMGPA